MNVTQPVVADGDGALPLPLSAGRSIAVEVNQNA
jgi:hypothetical protein